MSSFGAPLASTVAQRDLAFSGEIHRLDDVPRRFLRRMESG